MDSITIYIRGLHESKDDDSIKYDFLEGFKSFTDKNIILKCDKIIPSKSNVCDVITLSKDEINIDTLSKKIKKNKYDIFRIGVLCVITDNFEKDDFKNLNTLIINANKVLHSYIIYMNANESNDKTKLVAKLRYSLVYKKRFNKYFNITSLYLNNYIIGITDNFETIKAIYKIASPEIIQEIQYFIEMYKKYIIIDDSTNKIEDSDLVFNDNTYIECFTKAPELLTVLHNKVRTEYTTIKYQEGIKIITIPFCIENIRNQATYLTEKNMNEYAFNELKCYLQM